MAGATIQSLNDCSVLQLQDSGIPVLTRFLIVFSL